MHYLLFYEVGKDYVSQRAQFRAAHLEKAWQASKRGELVLGGALANPADGAVLLFQGQSPAVAEDFARSDPYVTNGLVTRWYVREWTTVAGESAATPVRPASSGDKAARLAAAVTDGSSPRQMVLRTWKGKTSREKADAYISHLREKVFPELRAIAGHRGGYLLRRPLDDGVEFLVLTLWDSMDAVRRFAGAEPNKAVVAPDARAILDNFDSEVTHFEMVLSPRMLVG